MPSGGKRPGAGRPPPDPTLVAEALALAAQSTPEDAADRLRERGKRVSAASIRNWQKGKHVAGYASAAASSGALSAPPPPPDPMPPPTDAERKVDELVAKSRTWRRVMGALADFAREHPAVAPALAAKLRGLNL